MLVQKWKHHFFRCSVAMHKRILKNKYVRINIGRMGNLHVCAQI